jgi:hypothetical protein
LLIREEDQEAGPALVPFDPTGRDERANLIRFHQREWGDIEKIRKLAIQASTDDKFNASPTHQGSSPCTTPPPMP